MDTSKRIYTVTITAMNCGKTATYTFDNEEDQQKLLDYIDTLTIEDDYYIENDSYFICDNIESTKQEVLDFINGKDIPEMFS